MLTPAPRPLVIQISHCGIYYDKVTLGLAYGKAPDVFILHTDRLPEYADGEALNCIDDLVTAGGLQPKDFMPRAWSATRWKGHQYAIPLDCHPICRVAGYLNEGAQSFTGISHK